MPNIEITFKLPKNGFMKVISKAIEKELKLVSVEIQQRLEREIKEVHRYQHRERNLRDATKYKGDVTKKDGLKIYVDLDEAFYGKFIIEGHGTWKPDDYLTNALEKYKPWILKKVDTALSKAASKFNNS